MSTRITFNVSKTLIIDSIDAYVKAKKELKIRTSRSDVISFLLESTVPFLDVAKEQYEIAKKIDDSLFKSLDRRLNKEKTEDIYLSFFHSKSLVINKHIVITREIIKTYNEEDDKDEITYESDHDAINNFLYKKKIKKFTHENDVIDIVCIIKKSERDVITINSFFIKENGSNHDYDYENIIKIKTESLVIHGITSFMKNFESSNSKLNPICWIPLSIDGLYSYLLPVVNKRNSTSDLDKPRITVIE